MEISQKIEAVLFWKGEPLSRKKLSDTLKVTIEEVNDGLVKLEESLTGRGVVLVQKDDEVTLGTATFMSELIENLRKEELNKDLSKATLETLSVVLYKNGASRSEIDYIRGVNSSFTLRALSIRGLVEKIPDPSDSRKYLYKPSFELLQHMGVQKVEDLPDFSEVNISMLQASKSMQEESAKESIQA